MGLATEDIDTLRQCSSACLDYVFMNRAESGYHILREDIIIVPGELLGFCEQRTKLTRARLPGSRFCTTLLRGLPQLSDLLLRWESACDHAWPASPDPTPADFWRLPGEGAL